MACYLFAAKNRHSSRVREKKIAHARLKASKTLARITLECGSIPVACHHQLYLDERLERIQAKSLCGSFILSILVTTV